MYQVRKSEERGRTSIPQLEALHSFAYADYYDPNHASFGTLRVLNEDWLEQGGSLQEHQHINMEILTYVVEGTLLHLDSMGNKELLRAGDFQVMSSGSGIAHSEANASTEDSVHFFQIWLSPKRFETDPSYQQLNNKTFKHQDNWSLLASADGHDDSLQLHQDASVYVAKIPAEESLPFDGNASHQYWLQVVTGQITVGKYKLSKGDGIAIKEENGFCISAIERSEVLLLDLLS
ncbi:MAG: pirin family protein [Myxococcota bacterium]|nr:pirin family protein [Myxococcota bacterium]